MELTDQTALITGGTAGIGLACARLLAGEGASVIITGRDAQRGEAARRRTRGSVRFIQADLSDIESVKSLVQQAGDVDILVNNAASFPGALTVDQDVASFEKTFDTNVRGTYFLAAGLVPGNARAGRGSIINVTTMVASKGVPGASAYSASKAAVESLTRTWAAEFGPAGSGSTASRPDPPKPKAWRRNGATPTKSWAVHCRWAAPPSPRRSPMRCSSSPHHARASSPARRCTPTAAAPLSESPIERGTIMSKNYDAAWENALTVVQEVQPPFIPDGAHAMTVVIDYPPGSAGAPPHRHPSGPAFGYMLEGEMLFELEGAAAAGHPRRRGVLGTGRRRHPLLGRQQPRRRPLPLHRHDALRPGPADARPRRRRRTGRAQAPARTRRVHADPEGSDLRCQDPAADDDCRTTPTTGTSAASRCSPTNCGPPATTWSPATARRRR